MTPPADTPVSLPALLDLLRPYKGQFEKTPHGLIRHKTRTDHTTIERACPMCVLVEDRTGRPSLNIDFRRFRLHFGHPAETPDSPIDDVVSAADLTAYPLRQALERILL